jgi:hypothetical protein
MTQFASLTLKDKDAADVVFAANAINYQTGVANWRNAGTSFDVSPSVTFSMSLPTAKSTRFRVKGKVVVPVPDLVQTSVKIDEIIMNLDFSIPKSATLAQRSNALAFVQTYLTNTIMSAAVSSLNGVY